MLLEGLWAGEAFGIAFKRESVSYTLFISSCGDSSKQKRKALVSTGAFFRHGEPVTDNCSAPFHNSLFYRLGCTQKFFGAVPAHRSPPAFALQAISSFYLGNTSRDLTNGGFFPRWGGRCWFSLSQPQPQSTQRLGRGKRARRWPRWLCKPNLGGED